MIRRPDPLETSARELAVAAGIDPNSRVPKSGSGMPAWCTSRDAARADLEESPVAYCRLPDVPARHFDTAKVLHTLRPFAVAMAGEGEFDPWKD